jgi:hypothetical protein
MPQDTNRRALNSVSRLSLHRLWSEYNRDAWFALSEGRIERAADPIKTALKPFQQRRPVKVTP